MDKLLQASNGPAFILCSFVSTVVTPRFILRGMPTYVALSSLESGGEQRAIDQTLRKLRRPAEVKGWQVEFGDDASGDPAVWVRLQVPEGDKVAASSGRVSELASFTFRVQQALLKAGLTRWPYVSVEGGVV